MRAICVVPDQSVARSLVVRDVPAPAEPPAEHLVVRMATCAINPGDKFFLSVPAPRAAPRSRHDVWGASGAGTVIAVGAGVPPAWLGRRVAVYRSLWPSEHVVGTWCTEAQLPMRCCALIPEGLDARDFSGSLVNVMTAYAFARQALADGHRGLLITAGTSATGIALLGLALRWGLPVVTIARDGAGRERLRALGAEAVAVQSDGDFETGLQAAVEGVAATAVFDGVGGALLTRIAPRLALGSTVFSYGLLGGRDAAFQMASSLLMAKSLTLRSFSNFASPTVRDPERLDVALRDIGELLALPHCKTPLGRTFGFDAVAAALAALDDGGGKPVLLPG